MLRALFKAPSCVRLIHLSGRCLKDTVDYSKVPVLHEDELEEQFVKGNGPGCSGFNKTVNCVVLLHKPSVRLIHLSGRRPKFTIDYSKVPVLLEDDLEEQFVKGSGPGGQAVNKTVNCVVLIHKPTGIVVKCHESRLLHKNREIARSLMVSRLDDLLNGENSVEAQRKASKEKKSVAKDRKRNKLEELKKSWKELVMELGLGDCVLVIRNYQPRDEEQCRRIVRQATMSTVRKAFISALTREVALQLVVITSAIMFVFMGLSPLGCLLSIPLSAIIMLTAIYLATLFNALTMADMMDIPRTYMSSEYTGFWVAEAFTSSHAPNASPGGMVRILQESDASSYLQDNSGRWSRRLVGTAAVVGSTSDSSAAWMRRMAVVPPWRRHGVAAALIDQALNFCREKGYESIELVTSECHTGTRELYTSKGFELRQLYHKQIFANIVQVLMYEYTFSFK